MNFLQKTSILFSVFFSFSTVNAQDSGLKNNCGTKNPTPAWEMEFQKLVTQRSLNQQANKTQMSYIIPIIIHVIHGGQPVGNYPNITQGQANWQVAMLNNDFAGTGINFSNYPANAFAAWASTANVSPASLDGTGRVAIANCNIQFCLATQDTNGNILPEPGIDRINYTTAGLPNPAASAYNSYSTFVNMFENAIKPQTIWDVTKYLNIWVSDKNSGVGFGGYATYPYLSTLNDLPVSSIGTATNDGIYSGAFEFGYYNHLVTHEVGHWLGLWHPWGDTLCGNDYCNDTPPAASESIGSPPYPYNVNACGSAGNGVMFMNFMDYSDDSDRYMFTTDQANRMQTTMFNSPYRKFLGTHNLCSVQNVAPFSWFYSLNSICTGKELSLNNESYGWPAPSYTWSASDGTISPGPQAVSPNIQFSSPGIYTISLTSSNGTLSAFTKTISVTSPVLYFSSTSQTICQGAVANFTVDGVTSYTWQPGNIMNSTVSFTPMASQTYTCEGLEVNNCRTSAVVEVEVSPCVGIDTYAGDQLKLFLYPNPAKEIMNLQLTAKLTSALVIQITDAVGRIIHQETLNAIAKEQLFPIDISTFDDGIYFIKVQAADGFTKTEKFVKKR